MKKDEYIREVVSQMQNKKAKAEVEKELSNHIDDRISYYTDAGYDEQSANEKAMEHMGEPKKVGIQMAKIHKRNVLKVIAISLLIAIVLTSVVLIFTTPIVAKYYSYKYDKKYCTPTEEGEIAIDHKDVDYFYVARKSGKLMNLVYKINPSQNNLDACHGIYSVTMLEYGLYYNNAVPDDYMESCIKYAEKMYNSEYREEYSNGLFSITVVPIVPDQQKQWKIGWGIDYAIALYLDGQIEESKKVIEECISLVGDSEDHAVMYITMKEYFYYVYASTDDVALKNWIIEKENEINETCKGMKKYKKFFMKRDHIYENTQTLDEYFDGQWGSYEDNYDIIIDNITKKIIEFTAKRTEDPESGVDLASMTASELVDMTGPASDTANKEKSDRTIVTYKFDDRLTFEIYDIDFSEVVFYLDGKEYKTVELDK